MKEKKRSARELVADIKYAYCLNNRAVLTNTAIGRMLDICPTNMSDMISRSSSRFCKTLELLNIIAKHNKLGEIEGFSEGRGDGK